MVQRFAEDGAGCMQRHLVSYAIDVVGNGANA
jgi:hypothetical protein